MRVLPALVLAGSAAAQQSVWGQCQHSSNFIGTNLANESKVAEQDGQAQRLVSRDRLALSQMPGTLSVFPAEMETL